MAIGPKAVDVGLNSVRDVGVEFARSVGRHQTNLSFLEWDEGTRHNTWIISSAYDAGLVGPDPIPLSRKSIVRVVGAVALLIGVALAKAYVPWGDAYGKSLSHRVPSSFCIHLSSHWPRGICSSLS